MKSRIEKYHHNNNFCELDGTKCINCCKCDYINNKTSTNKFTAFLITLIIICVIIFILAPMITAEIHHQNINDNMISDDKTQNYNLQMSDDEKQYREYVGLGAESVGENYNSMG